MATRKPVRTATAARAQRGGRGAVVRGARAAAWPVPAPRPARPLAHVATSQSPNTGPAPQTATCWPHCTTQGAGQGGRVGGWDNGGERAQASACVGGSRARNARPGPPRRRAAHLGKVACAKDQRHFGHCSCAAPRAGGPCAPSLPGRVRAAAGCARVASSAAHALETAHAPAMHHPHPPVAHTCGAAAAAAACGLTSCEGRHGDCAPPAAGALAPLPLPGRQLSTPQRCGKRAGHGMGAWVARSRVSMLAPGRHSALERLAAPATAPAARDRPGAPANPRTTGLYGCGPGDDARRGGGAARSRVGGQQGALGGHLKTIAAARECRGGRAAPGRLPLTRAPARCCTHAGCRHRREAAGGAVQAQG